MKEPVCFSSSGKGEEESEGKTDLLVEFEPGAVAFTVHILQAKEPDLPQSHRLHHLRTTQNGIRLLTAALLTNFFSRISHKRTGLLLTDRHRVIFHLCMSNI